MYGKNHMTCKRGKIQGKKISDILLKAQIDYLLRWIFNKKSLITYVFPFARLGDPVTCLKLSQSLNSWRRKPKTTTEST